MGKRSPERWEKVKKWVREKAKTTYFWLALLALFVLLMLLWVAFGSHNNCSCHYVCWLLGVTEKAVALKTLGFVIAGIAAFWGVMAANRRSDAMAESAKASADTAKANADTAKANADTAKATEAGNRQRAFKDGLERLGSEKASMRLIGARAQPCFMWPWKTRNRGWPLLASSARTSGKPLATKTTKKRTKTSPPPRCSRC